MNILIATNNQHKIIEINEIAAILKCKHQFFTPKQLNINCQPNENGQTLTQNSQIKAVAFYNAIKNHNLEHIDATMADDTGLEIEALNNMPGVHSARFANNTNNQNIDTANRAKVLELMANKQNRNARFITIITITNATSTKYYTGQVDGTITKEELGTNGFGYDPIFKPNGSNKTFAQMTKSEKNNISHRRNAIVTCLKDLS